jgi:DNA-binding MarR family transcriptional regulator
MRSYADQRLKGYELTVEQLHVLKNMSGGVAQTQKELCAATGKSAANLTRILDRLEKKKRVVRRKAKSDRRASLVSLTAEGERLQLEVTQLFDALGEDILSGITAEQQRIAAEVLAVIRARIDTGLLKQGER